MKVFKAPEQIKNPYDLPSVFLAGAIDMGQAEDWQSKITDALEDVECVVLNPRRDDWDSSWEQSIENDQFREQVEWELDGMESATYIAMCLTKDSKAPISLLELGLHATDGKMLVFCPEGFYRKGNVDVVCKRYGVPVYGNFDEFTAEVVNKAGLPNTMRKKRACLVTATDKNHKDFANKKDALAFLDDHALMSVGWPEGDGRKEACYWNGKLLITKAAKKASSDWAAERVARQTMLRAFVTGMRYQDKPHLEIPQFPIAANICPICKEQRKSGCRCSGPHTLEDLKVGHGSSCVNGHRWSGDVVYDPAMKTAADANMEYDRKLKDVRNLVKALQRLIDKHEARQGGRTEDWGFVGDLEHLEGQLTEMVRFIGGGTKG